MKGQLGNHSFSGAGYYIVGMGAIFIIENQQTSYF